MNYMAIDVGTYSIKFVRYSVQRKELEYQEVHEVFLAEFSDQLGTNYSLRDLQSDIIKTYLQDSGFEGKLIYQAPHTLFTNRVIDLPVKNKKKAELMIPFQLEEDLPYPISQVHFSSSFLPKGQGQHALVAIADRQEFEDHYNYLDNKGVLPAILTTEASVFQSHCYQERYIHDFAILDIGHSTTKAYFFSEGRITSTHLAFMGGKVIEEVIAETYQIPLEEAIIYKHKNSFFLTEGQLEAVDEDQKEFGKLMKNIMAPLLSDVRKWELGHRVKHGRRIDVLYLCGGTSRINNITNFFSQNLSIKTEHLNVLSPKSAGHLPYDPKAFLLAGLMAKGPIYKLPLLNLRSGSYSSSDLEGLPLHSATFLGTRSLIVFLVLFLSLLAERILINRDISTYDKRIAQILKNTTLAIPPRVQREYRARPERVHGHFKEKEKEIQQEIKTLQSATRENVISPLAQLGQLVGKGTPVELIEYSSSGDMAQALFSAENIQTLVDLERKLNSSGPAILDTELMEQDKKLRVELRGP